jgi:prephenate dehydratase
MATAFLGPRGSFSEEAALLRVETDQLVAFSSFPALISAVETGLADEAVLPIENSIEGAVSTTLDLLIHETALRISGELALPVRHFLVTRPGVHLEDVRVVTSHPQALGQCRRFLERCMPGVEQVAALSTSGAVKEVRKERTSTAPELARHAPPSCMAARSSLMISRTCTPT